MTTSPDHPPPQLDYAQRQRLAWLARHRRAIISLALLLAIAGPVGWNWQSLKRRVLWLYWFHRAAAHVMPPPDDTLIIGPQATNIPTTRPGYIGTTPSITSLPSISYFPQACLELAEMDGRLDPLWDSYHSNIIPLVFMGTLRRPDGQSRLVIISGRGDTASDHMLYDTRAVILPMPGLFDPFPPAGRTRPASVAYGYSSPFGTSYRTATIDPKDLSHIIIQCTYHSNFLGMIAARQKPLEIPPPGEIDAFLQNDNQLHFALRGHGRLASQAMGTTTPPRRWYFRECNFD